MKESDVLVNFNISKSQYNSVFGSRQIKLILNKKNHYFKFYDLQEVETNSKYQKKWTFRKNNTRR